MGELTYWVALTLTDGVGPKTFQQLLETFGSPKEALEASVEELMGVSGVGPSIAKRIRKSAQQLERFEEMLGALSEEGVWIVTFEDSSYPENLKLIQTPPPVLFVRGTLELDDMWAVAIVGSRKASDAGKELAHRLASELAQRGLTIVSGLAEGIDTAAHTGALDAGGRTLAALGSGILRPENPELAHRIQRRGGLLSEFNPNASVSVNNWMARNRIVTGLSLAVIMVEGAEKSGSVHAAKIALEQKRAVFVVDWNDNDPAHAGNRNLLAQGAGRLPTDFLGFDALADEIMRMAVKRTGLTAAASLDKGK